MGSCGQSDQRVEMRRSRSFCGVNRLLALILPMMSPNSSQFLSVGVNMGWFFAGSFEIVPPLLFSYLPGSGIIISLLNPEIVV